MEYEDPPESWRHFPTTAMPKESNSVAPEMFRWVSPQTVPAKMLDGCLVELVHQYGVPLPDNLVGYRAGRQGMEVSEGARVLFQKAYEWRGARTQFQLWAAQLDILQAFEYVPVPLIYEAFLARKVPHRIILALVTPLLGRCLHITVAGRPMLVLRMHRSLVTGGKASGEIWNTVVWYVTLPLFEKWRREGHLLEIAGEVTSLGTTIYADNFLVLGHKYDNVHQVLGDIIVSFLLHDIFPKSSSLQIMASDTARAEMQTNFGTTQPQLRFDFTIEFPESKPYEFKWVDDLTVLGTKVDYRGSDLTALQYRKAQALQVWGRERRLLLSKGLDRNKRISRLDATVFTSFLYGAGAWRLTPKEASQLAAFQVQLGRTVLRQRKTDLQQWPEFLSAAKFVVHDQMSKAGVEGLRARQLRLHHRWLGHVARLSPSSSLISYALTVKPKEQWRIVQAIHEETVRPSAGHHEVHACVGRHRTYDDIIEKHHGAFWKVRACNRDDWKTHEDNFVQSFIEGLEPVLPSQRHQLHASATEVPKEPDYETWAPENFLRKLKPKTVIAATSSLGEAAAAKDINYAYKLLSRQTLINVLSSTALSTSVRRLATAAAFKQTLAERKFSIFASQAIVSLLSKPPQATQCLSTPGPENIYIDSRRRNALYREHSRWHLSKQCLLSIGGHLARGIADPITLLTGFWIRRLIRRGEALLRHPWNIGINKGFNVCWDSSPGCLETLTTLTPGQRWLPGPMRPTGVVKMVALLRALSSSSSSSLRLEIHRVIRSFSPLEFIPGRTQFLIHSRRRLVDSLRPSRSCSNSSSASLTVCSRWGPDFQILEPGLQILWAGWVAGVTGGPNGWPRGRWLVFGSFRELLSHTGCNS
jgi:hypothetical protein